MYWHSLPSDILNVVVDEFAPGARGSQGMEWFKGSDRKGEERWEVVLVPDQVGNILLKGDDVVDGVRILLVECEVGSYLWTSGWDGFSRRRVSSNPDQLNRIERAISWLSVIRPVGAVQRG